VRPRDYLYKIAEEQYGIANDTLIDMIHMANPDIVNVDQIYPGQKIKLPYIRKSDLIVETENNQYLIHYASFYSFTEAKQVLENLLKINKKVFFIPVVYKDNIVYRIYIGTFANKKDVYKTLANMDLKLIPFLNKDSN
jgi:hypothetical protein